MENIKLSDRQKREEEYFDELFSLQKQTEITFDPVLGEEKRPWNSYWYVYDLAREEYNRGRKNLLDFGCGMGVASVRLAKIGYNVSGFDISENNIASANNLAQKYGLEKKTVFSKQTAEHLDYPPESFDIITGIDILHHVEIESAIKECSRLLKKDGVAIFREHFEAVFFDWLRKTKLVRSFFPEGKSFDRKITEDERKLTNRDLRIIQDYFPKTVTYRFGLFSRLKPLVKINDQRKSFFLEKVDYFIFKTLPFLKCFGDDMVLVLRK